jgi:acyl-CoA synthetase (AMP-forming)/AMP-acid ligase II
MRDFAPQDAGPGCIREWVDRAARLYPDKPYVVSVEDGRSINYAQFAELTQRLAIFLRGKGIATNDRIALVAGNSIEHIACFVGVLAYGATICTVHVEMNRRHLGRIIAQLKPRLAIHDDEHADLARAEIAADGAAKSLALGRWDTPQPGTLFAAVRQHRPHDTHPPATGPRDDAVILFTSGTGDRPKGVVLSYREHIGNIEPMTHAFGMSSDDRVYDFRSFNWSSGQSLGVLGPLAHGATLVMAKRFSASRFFDDLRSHRVTIAAGNPTTINMLLNTEQCIDAKDLPKLRFITSSSAPLAPQEWRRFEERFGIPVAQGYGSSETAWIAANPGRERRVGSVGKPLAYHRLAIVDARGRGLPTGEIGEVEVGAFDDNAYRYLGGDGTVEVAGRGRWRTGDMGFLDADGFLHLTGREKELIIRGGVNISPVEIDGVLMQRAEIAEAATIGVPDRVWGEEVVSYVVLRPGTRFTPEELLAFCAAQLPAFKAPKQILLRNELPKSERGKLDRKALVAEWNRERSQP